MRRPRQGQGAMCLYHFLKFGSVCSQNCYKEEPQPSQTWKAGWGTLWIPLAACFSLWLRPVVWTMMAIWKCQVQGSACGELELPLLALLSLKTLFDISCSLSLLNQVGRALWGFLGLHLFPTFLSHPVDWPYPILPFYLSSLPLLLSLPYHECLKSVIQSE